MIIDTIDRLPLYEPVIPKAAQIAAAFSTLKPDEAGVEVREKAYMTKTDEKRRFEVHFRTIDLMLIRNGAEIIHICPIEKTQPAEALPNGADGRKLDGTPKGTAVHLETGSFCAIFPGEAHMVGGQVDGIAGSLEKWVVKIPAEEHFCIKEDL